MTKEGVINRGSALISLSPPRWFGCPLNFRSGLPHSFPSATEGRPDGLAELPPIPEMADEAWNVAQPPPDVSL
jgi:hypothetical protein